MPSPNSNPDEKELRQLIQIAKRDLSMDDASFRIVLRGAGGADPTTARARALWLFPHALGVVKSTRRPPWPST